jgi:phosphinothricin acetyltransferase
MVLVRPARHEDAAAIAEIYNQGIRGRGATFETEERTVEEREQWLASHGPEYPCLVAISAGEYGERVVGWASTSAYRSRECYRGSPSSRSTSTRTSVGAAWARCSWRR